MNHIEWSQEILYDLFKSWLKNPTQVSPHVKLGYLYFLPLLRKFDSMPQIFAELSCIVT